MKKIKKKTLNLIVFVVIVMAVSVVGVYAERIIASSIVTYDNKTSKLSSTNVQGAIDELYAKCISTGASFNFVKYLQALESSSTVLTDDGTAGHNMRYIGADPKNWVSFNGELWRIIGIFGTDSHGQSNKLIKIQYSSNLGQIKWDDNNVNDWSQSTLKTYLNAGEYYTKTLKAEAKQMIQTVDWKIGGAPAVQATMYANVFYNYERGNAGSLSNPTIVKWNGNIALAYPSDYIFATSGGLTYGREDCISATTYITNGSENALWRTDGTNAGECSTGSWMIQQARNTKIYPWTLTPSSNSKTVFGINYASKDGFTHPPNASSIGANAIPAIYLKPNIICTNCADCGAGTQSKPYILTIA